MPDQRSDDDAGLHELRRPGSVMTRTAKGAGWAIFWRIANRSLGMISTLILVRLLSPADFGVVALAMTFAESLSTLGELGIENAIIRDDKPNRALYDTGFTINLLRGLGVAAIILLLAYPAAEFFHNPHFVPAVIFAAAVNAVGAFENIGIVDFRRFLAFEMEFKIKLIPRIISVFTAVSLASFLHSFWALLVAIFVGRCIATWLSYRMHPYRPHLTLVAWKRIASYSTLLWLSNIANLLKGFSANATIGRFIGAGAVGIYGVGAEIAGLPSSELVLPLTRAAFPGFSEVKVMEGGQGEMLLRLVGLTAAVTLPAAIGLSLIAAPLVHVAFGTRWLAAVPLVQIAGIGEAFNIFGSISRTLFAVRAWTKAMLKISLVTLFFQLLFLLIFLPRYGLVGAALATTLPNIVEQLVYFSMATRRLSISTKEIGSYLWRSVVACALMTVTLLLTNLGWTSPSPSESSRLLAFYLMEAVLVGAAVYILALVLLWFLSGQPLGPERDGLSLIRRFMGLSRSVETP